MDHEVTLMLDEETAAFITERVDEGRFPDAAAAVRAGMRALAQVEAEREETLDAIKRRVAASLADPRPPVPIDEAFRGIRQRLHAKYGPKSRS